MSEQVRSEQTQPQNVDTRTYALSGNRQAISGANKFAAAFEPLTRAASAIVPEFSGNTVVNAAVSAASNTRMAVTSGPMDPNSFYGNGGGGGFGAGAGPNVSGNPMDQMNNQINQMAYNNARLLAAQAAVGNIATTHATTSSILKARDDMTMRASDKIQPRG